VKADMTFDQDWPVSDMANLVLDFHSVDPNRVPQLTMPVSVVVDPEGSGGGLLYRSPGGSAHNFGDAEFPYQAGDLSVIEQVLGIDPNTDSMTGNPLPAPSSVTVAVVDGTGTGGAAATSSALAALGFRAVGVSAEPPAGDVTETVVYYGSRSPAAEAAAEAVARSMSGAVVMGYDPTRVVDGAQVTVVTGSDFSVNPPPPPPAAASGGHAGAAPPSSAPAPAPTATTAPPPSTAAATASSSAVQPPSPPSTALEPWDPRACPPGAVPTAPVANLT